MVWDPGLSTAVNKIILEKTEANWFHIINTSKYLYTVNWVVVILVVEQNPLFNNDLLVWVTDIYHTKGVVR